MTLYYDEQYIVHKINTSNIRLLTNILSLFKIFRTEDG